MNSLSSSMVRGNGDGLGVRAGEITPLASTCHWHLNRQKRVSEVPLLSGKLFNICRQMKHEGSHYVLSIYSLLKYALKKMSILYKTESLEIYLLSNILL